MPELRRLTIEELCRSGIAELQTGPFGSQLHAYDYVDSGVPVVPTEAIRNRRIEQGRLPQITAAKAGELHRHRLRKGDILFARRGVQATGQSAYVRDEEEGFVCGTGAIRLRVRPDNKLIRSNFLSHLLMNSSSRAWLRHNAIGATMPNLNEEIIRRFSFLVPPVEDQGRAADLLDAFDEKIELNRRMNVTLEAMARAIFKDWFVDFGPTRAKKEGRTPYLAADIWSLFPESFDFADSPLGWNNAPLTHFFEIIGGGTPRTSEPKYWDGSIPWFSVVDTPPGSEIFVFDTEKNITETGLQSSSARLLEPGQTIVSARGTVGNLAMVGRPMAFNQSCYGLKGVNNYGACFVFLAAKHMVSRLQALAHGSVFSTITRQTFDSVHLCAAGGAVAYEFESATSVFFDRIRANVVEARTLAETRDLLLPELMSGDVRLRDAEELVGRAT